MTYFMLFWVFSPAHWIWNDNHEVQGYCFVILAVFSGFQAQISSRRVNVWMYRHCTKTSVTKQPLKGHHRSCLKWLLYCCDWPPSREQGHFTVSGWHSNHNAHLFFCLSQRQNELFFSSVFLLEPQFWSLMINSAISNDNVPGKIPKFS